MAAACDGAGMRRILRGTDLRYTLTRLIQVLGPMTVSDLCAQLETLNFGVEGRPTKVVSDALRWEMGRDRVIRRGRGLYGEGWAPSGTAYRIVDRVESLKVEAESLRGGKTATRSFDRVSDNPFNPALWTPVGDLDAHFADLTDITYHRHVIDGVLQPTVRVAFDRPEVRNAFRPHTVDELFRVLDHARMSPDVGVVLLTGNGPSPKDGGWAFCSGGDQRIRGRSGYQYAAGETAETVDPARAGRLHILEVQRLIRFMPKPVICLVNGWAAGGGHSLHVVCDLTLASREHARFKQTDADVGSFDGGYGSAYLARQVGQKFAREIFFLGEPYTAEQMHQMGAVNRVVDHADLENVALEWAQKINGKSPQAQRMLKFAFNLLDDGLVGQQIFAGEATRLAYMTDEAVEGRDAFLEKREPDWTPFPRYF